jgi:hypothetical protein
VVAKAGATLADAWDEGEIGGECMDLHTLGRQSYNIIAMPCSSLK